MAEFVGLSPGVRREVTATKHWFAAVDNFTRVFAIRPGEKVLFLADPLLDPRVIDAVSGVARARGAEVRVYMEPSSRVTEVPDAVKPLLEQADFVVSTWFCSIIDPFCIAMRKRGQRETEFGFAATATDGENYMVPLFLEPWVAAHKAAGVSLADAEMRQVHPDIWLWMKGGIDDNPHTSQKQRDWFHSQKFASEEERQVRLFGGFGRFNRRPVFDQQALRMLEEQIDEWDKARGPGRNRGICRVEAA